jgi:predicted kinase
MMDHAELLRLVEAHERADMELKAGRIAVWDALVKAEPELASETLQLFSTIEAAAHWVTSSLNECNGSPARRAAEGRAAEIISMVRKTTHGFVG